MLSLNDSVDRILTNLKIILNMNFQVRLAREDIPLDPDEYYKEEDKDHEYLARNISRVCEIVANCKKLCASIDWEGKFKDIEVQAVSLNEYSLTLCTDKHSKER